MLVEVSGCGQAEKILFAEHRKKNKKKTQEEILKLNNEGLCDMGLCIIQTYWYPTSSKFVLWIKSDLVMSVQISIRFISNKDVLEKANVEDIKTKID